MNQNAKNSSYRVALCGLIIALSVILMFMTGLFPFSTYALPAISGLLLASVVIEFNCRTALLAFAGVSLLSIFISPSKEAAIIFITLFGYYPILKFKIEQLNRRIIEWIIKIVIFNTSILLTYLGMIYVFRMSELIEEFAEYSRMFLVGLLIFGNFAFVIYDIACTRMITLYLNTLRPKLTKQK